MTRLTEDEAKHVAMLKAHALNHLQTSPQSVEANDKLWLCQLVERLTRQAPAPTDGGFPVCGVPTIRYGSTPPTVTYEGGNGENITIRRMTP